MEQLFFPVLSLALQWFRPRYNAQLQILEAQIRILRSRIARVVLYQLRRKKRNSFGLPGSWGMMWPSTSSRY